MAKYKIVKKRRRRSNETIAEADDLDELARMLSAKTGAGGLGLSMSDDELDLGFGGGDDGGLL
jgi:hypothetical protein